MQPNAFDRFKELHNQFQKSIQNPDHDLEEVSQLALRYISAIADKDSNQNFRQKIFDYFCEHGGVFLLQSLLKIDQLMAIKNYSLLLINLNDSQYISYILCQPFLNQAISVPPKQEEQWAEYFLAFLKSLSIRLTPEQITLFYNKRNSIFPLIYHALNFLNHPDCMVRTNVMSIVLEIMKINVDVVEQYFSRFPFTTFIISLCCQIRNLILALHQNITNEDKNLKSKYLRGYHIDLSDFLYYLNDLFTYGTEKLKVFMRNAFLSYVILPLAKQIVTQGIATNSKLINSVLLVFHECLKTLKDNVILENIILLIFSPKLNPKIVDKIRCEMYIPLVLQKQFDLDNFYWNKFSGQIQSHCMSVFKNVQNFEVYQIKETSQNLKAEFKEEINKISQFIGVDILSEQQLGSKSIIKLMGDYQQFENENMVLRTILKCYEQNPWSESCTILNGIIALIIRHSSVSQKVKKQCELDNINSKMLQEIKSIVIRGLCTCEWLKLRLVTIKNSILVLSEIAKNELSIERQEDVVSTYRSLTLALKNEIKPERIQIVIQHFQSLMQHVQSQQSYSYLKETPLYLLLSSQSRIQHHSQDISLVEMQNKQACFAHLVVAFAFFRRFYVTYFKTIYDLEFSNFSSLFHQRFGRPNRLLKIGKSYQIMNKNLFICKIVSSSVSFGGAIKKNRKGILIEDEQNLIIAEDDGEKKQGTILVNIGWKGVQAQINRDEGSNILIRYGTGNNTIYLSFQDQLESNMMLSWMMELKRKRAHEELAFILKFVRNCSQQ